MEESPKFRIIHIVTAMPSGIVRRVKPNPGAEILVPPIRQTDGMSFAVAALLPNRDHNSALMDFLDHRPALSGSGSTAAAVFAADPFLHRPGLETALRAAGVSGVVNFPPTDFLGRDFASALSEVGLGFDRDLDLLRWFADRGFETGCFVSTEDQAATAAMAGIDWLVLSGPAEAETGHGGERPEIGNADVAGRIGSAVPHGLDRTRPPLFAYREAPPEPDHDGLSALYDGAVVVHAER